MSDTTNPFATPSPLPFQYPPFDRIGMDHYRPAFDAGVVEQDAEIAAIVANPAEPDFDNTIGAMESSGRLLDRTLRVFFELAGSMATDEMQALLAELAPLDSAHEDAILLNAGLFARVEAVHRKRAELDLTEEQSRVLERYHTDFVRAGAALPVEEQERLRALNEQITTLTTEFGRQLLAEANSLAVHVAERAELDGLPESV
ncbi:MAG: M3 family metallopeptidase, partial [Nocardioidaceae bacterium]